MIDDKALELGRLIGQSTEYQTLRRTELELKNDPATTGNARRGIERTPS